jgi:lipoprotein
MILINRLFAVATLGICLSFFSCDKNNKEEVDYTRTSEGVYKVELSLSGDIENFQPMVMVVGNYTPWYPEQFIFDKDGQIVENVGGVGYNYKDNPETFPKHIIHYTTKKARGMAVTILCGNSQGLFLQPSPKVKIDYKGYYNGKLIKNFIKELDPLTNDLYGSQAYILIGQDMQGQYQN